MPGYDTLDEIILWLIARREHHQGIMRTEGPTEYADQLAFVIAEYDDMIQSLQAEQRRRAR